MPAKEKIMSLEACSYEDLPKHTKVFNSQAVEYHLWIYLNPEDVRTAYFYGAEEIGPNANNNNIFPDTFVRESQCWIRVNREYINNIPGKHTIRLKFVDRYTDTDFSLYVSYYIQNDNPDKPYVYITPVKEQIPLPIPPGPTFTPYSDDYKEIK